MYRSDKEKSVIIIVRGESCIVLTIVYNRVHYLNKLFEMFINRVSDDFEVVFIDKRGVSSTSENTPLYYIHH